MNVTPHRLSLAGAALASVFGLILAGCGSAHVESSFQGGLDTLGLTASRVALLNLERNSRFSLVIEAAADSIARLSSDRQVKRNAMRWKLAAIPAMREALFFGDPAVGSMDAWAFTFQMQDYLENGGGKDLFGEFQPIALRVCAKLDSMLTGERTDSSVHAYSLTLRGQIRKWARALPIENSLLERPTVVQDLADLDLAGSTSLGGIVGDIGQSVRDLSARVNIYATQVPKEARWQVEYLAQEYRIDERLDTLDSQAADITKEINRLVGLIEGGGVTIDIRALKQLREDLLRLEDILATERVRILADVDRQRLETIAAVERLSEATMKQAEARGIAIVDHLMWRVAQILAGLAFFVMLFLVGFRLLGGKHAARM